MTSSAQRLPWPVETSLDLHQYPSTVMVPNFLNVTFVLYNLIGYLAFVSKLHSMGYVTKHSIYLCLYPQTVSDCVIVE